MANNLPRESVNAAISKLTLDAQKSNNGKATEENKIYVERKAVTTSSQKGKDITTKFFEAASALQTGELVKDDFFTLFEAVGALEIMDSKMDSGYLESGETLEDTYDVLRDLLPEELVGIMDALLCHEVSWNMGQSLSVTVFSSVYIDRILYPEPKVLEEASFTRGQDTSCVSHSILRAYCLGLIKTCDFVLDQISRQTYYEEEDFHINLYNRSLLTAFDVDDVLEILDSAIASLGKLHKDLPAALYSALRSRLDYRKALLQAVAMDMNFTTEERKASWNDCKRLFNAVYKSHDLGRAVPESFSAKIQRRLVSSVPPRPIVDLSFSAASDFLRKVHEDGVSVEHALECSRLSSLVSFIFIFQRRKHPPCVYMRCLLQELAFNKFKIQGKDIDDYREHFLNELRELVLPAHQLLDPANATIEAPQDPRFKLAQGMEKFVQAICEPYFDYIRALTMNRSRVRRTLCHTILDWDGLQIELEDLDTELRQHTHEEPLIDAGEEIWEFPLSSWAYDIKLQQMIWIVQLGFELQVYHPEELAFMYWYLQYLANARYRHTERILAFVKTNRSRLKNPTPNQKAAIDHCFSILIFNMEESLATSSLAEALSYLYLTLHTLSLVPSPPSASTLPYSTPTLRHALRLRPFLPISYPPIPLASDFETQTTSFIDRLPAPSDPIPNTSESSLPDIPALESRALSTLNHVDTLLRSARTGWERILKAEPAVARCVGSEEGWKVGIKDVVRSAIAAGVCVVGVRKGILEGLVARGREGGGGRGMGKEKVKVGKGIDGLQVQVEVPGVGSGGGVYHAWWVVPTAVKKKDDEGSSSGGRKDKEEATPAVSKGRKRR